MNFISKLIHLYSDKKQSDQEFDMIKSAVEKIDPEYAKHIKYFNVEDQRGLYYKRVKYFATAYHELEAENTCLKLELNNYRCMCHKKMNKKDE